MKFKSGFVLRNIAGENVLIPSGVETIKFNKLITLNETATWLWNQLQNRTFSEDDVTQMLTEYYGIDIELAKNDAHTICLKWSNVGIIE